MGYGEELSEQLQARKKGEECCRRIRDGAAVARLFGASFADPKAFGAAARAGAALTSLDVRRTPLGAAGAGALAAALEACPLRLLALWANELGADGAAALAPALALPTLTVLNLGENRVGDLGASALAAALRRSPVKNLDIKCDELGEVGISALGAALPASRVIDLDLEGSVAEPRALHQLANGLAAARSAGRPIDVCLRRTRCAGEDLAHVATHSLSLDCREIPLGASGMRALAPALSSPLQVLRLDQCGLGPEGGEALGAGLERNRALQALSLKANALGPAGAGAVCRALKAHPALQQLDLEQNGLGSGGAEASGVDVLLSGYNEALMLLDLKHNELEKGDADVLCRALQVPRRKSALSSVDLRGNALGPEGVAALTACAGDDGKGLEVFFQEEPKVVVRHLGWRKGHEWGDEAGELGAFGKADAPVDEEDVHLGMWEPPVSAKRAHADLSELRAAQDKEPRVMSRPWSKLPYQGTQFEAADMLHRLAAKPGGGRTMEEAGTFEQRLREFEAHFEAARAGAPGWVSGFAQREEEDTGAEHIDAGDLLVEE